MKILYLNNEKYYVYKHYIINKDGHENIFYIGKGKGDRIYNQRRNSCWNKIVKENNYEYYVDIIQYCNSEEEAYELENKLQEYYWSIGQCKGCADIKIKNNEIKVKKHIKNKINKFKKIKLDDTYDIFSNLKNKTVKIPIDNKLLSNKQVDYRVLLRISTINDDFNRIDSNIFKEYESLFNIKFNSIQKKFAKLRKLDIMTYDYETMVYTLKCYEYICLDMELVKFICNNFNSNEIKVFITILVNNLDNNYYLKGIKLAESVGLSSGSSNNVRFIIKATDKLYNYDLIDKRYNPSERKIVRYNVNKLILENIKCQPYKFDFKK